MKERISQSMMKDVMAYEKGELCGHILQRKWVDGVLIDDPTDAMKLGSYFEFICFGTLPKSGIKPKAEYNMNGTMAADYARAHEHRDVLLKWMKMMGLVVVHQGKRLTSGRFEGTIDLVVACTRKIVFQDGFVLKKGALIVIDIKYSGLLDDRWSKHGWMWTSEQREYHGIQAKQYHLITGLPFFFLVKDNTKAGLNNVKFFRVSISSDAIELHKAEGNAALEKLKMWTSFTAYPSVHRCAKCPLKDNCNDKHIFPHAELIEL